MATAQPTTNHREIQKWVEARGGHPARVKKTGSRKDPGILRIDFPGYSGEETLEEIDWKEWFDWFDRNKLAMLLSESKRSRFNKLVDRSTVKATPQKRTTSAKKTSSTKRTASASTKKAATRASTSSSATDGAAAKRTTNHATIKRWVEARGGFPAHVKRTATTRSAGVLRIDYPGYSGKQSLERMSWDEWFDAFDKNDLAFLYQNKKNSRFSKLVHR